MSADLRALIDELNLHESFIDGKQLAHIPVMQAAAVVRLKRAAQNLIAAISAPPVDLRPWVQHKPECRKGKPTLGCPTCGCQLKRVTRGPNSMLNAEQFDSAKAGDYYCDVCSGDQAVGTKYRYWWERELGKFNCSCGLDAVLAPLSGARQDEKEKELLTRVEPMGDSTDNRTAAKDRS